MAKKKAAKVAKPKVAGKTKAAKPKAAGPPNRAPGPIGGPDTSILARYSPTDSADAHPDWVKERFPEYVGDHGHHEASVVREFSFDGHLVRITTTYRVEVDGQPVHTPLSVDEDGRVFTHATPFVTYGSAVDLMKAVIGAYPEAFSGATGPGQDGHYDGHGHDG